MLAILLATGFFTGLARVPEFFTNEFCATQNPPHVEVFATKSRTKKLGDIRWVKEGDPNSFHCTPMFSGHELPLMEVDERGAFMVVEQSGDWVRIRLGKGTGWIHLSKADEVFSYEDLVTDALASLTDAWDGRIYAKPGGHFRTLEPDRHEVTVTESRRVN